jgi:hypothetical protein
MEWVIGGIVGAIVAAIVMMMMRGRGPSDPGAKADKFFAERDAKRATNRAEWLGMLERLPVVDVATSPLLHTPIYDCASDEFELPCAHANYEFHSSAVRGGMSIGFISAAEARTKIEDLSELSWPAVVVDGGDHLDLVYAATANLNESGGKVLRLVRTGADEFHSYGWRSGMNTGAKHDDPPFWVTKIVAQPQLWRDRLRTLQSRWQQNSNYTAALRRCSHRRV